MPMSDVIHANKMYPDFPCSRTSLSTRQAYDYDHDEHKENRPLQPHLDYDVIQPNFRFAGVDRNQYSLSAMKRTSTARTSLQPCTTQLIPEVSDIRPEADEAGTVLSDDSSTCDIDNVFSETESQLGTTKYLPNSK